jgi:S1-C subfamily serine protease
MGGEIKSPWLGIQGTTIDLELKTKLGLAVDRGIYVIGVVKGGPAEKAGLKESGVDNERQPASGGDIITAVDTVSVVKMEDLISYLNGKKPGDKITLTVHRGNQQMTLSVTLGEWPKETPS